MFRISAKITLLLILIAAYTSHAQTLTVLYDFPEAPQAAYPVGTLAQGQDGKLYGLSGFDSMVTFDPLSGVTTLNDLSGTGSDPAFGLTMSVDGTFYGTMVEGGTFGGTIFNLTSAGEVTNLYDFFDRHHGDGPTGLVQGVDGNLYGSTEGGGHGGCFDQYCGVIFEFNLSNQQYTLLHALVSSEGSQPLAAPIQAIDGNFYGTTFGDGAYNRGSVYRINSKKVFSVVHAFKQREGANSSASLVQGVDGNFYGTTQNGGAYGYGTIFKMDPNGRLLVLHDFNVSDGEYPSSALTLANDGNFYGTTPRGGTYHCGVLFRIDPNGTFQRLHDFKSPQGNNPLGLRQATTGVFYGLARFGGAGFGTLYSVDIGLPPFVAFARPAGKIGSTGPILGQGFTGTTSVAVNGVQASFTVVSDTQIEATIPPGATTGYVTVTTPSDVLTSNVPFHVLP